MVRNWKRGDRVKIKGGRYHGAAGTVDSAVFQRTDDQPDEFQHGYHVILDSGQVVTLSNKLLEWPHLTRTVQSGHMAHPPPQDGPAGPASRAT